MKCGGNRAGGMGMGQVGTDGTGQGNRSGAGGNGTYVEWDRWRLAATLSFHSAGCDQSTRSSRRCLCCEHSETSDRRCSPV